MAVVILTDVASLISSSRVHFNNIFYYYIILLYFNCQQSRYISIWIRINDRN